MSRKKQTNIPTLTDEEIKYYLGNTKLPKRGQRYKYTPEMLKELKKSANNILHFALNYFYIVSLDKGKIKIPLYSCQKDMLRKIRDNRFSVIMASRQSGKALALNTPIPTPHGWITMGELKAGDYVYGSDGLPTKVTHAHEILYNRDCYEITFDCGEKIIADGEHQWFTQSKVDRNRKLPGKVRTTKEVFETQNYFNEPMHRIPTVINGVENDIKKLPIAPWILGLWLGDGDSSTGSITSSKRDFKPTLENIHQYYDNTIVHEYYPGIYTIRITTKKNKKTNSLSSQLKQQNLTHNKHIPEIYFQSSRQQRLELLQGLIDSDGYIDARGNCSFYNSNINLAKQVKTLIESLGYKTTYKEYYPKLYNTPHKLTASVSFTPIENVATLPFKKNRIRQKDKIIQSKLRSQWHYIKNVKKIDSVPVRCITVEADDSLYLCGKNYIPTHNSTIITIFTLWTICFNEDQRVLIVANKEDTAKKIFGRVKVAYEMLPNWMKPGVEEWAKTAMKLENGSSISISTTSSDAGRGDSCNLLLLDELAFIPDSMMNDFWSSVYPIISSSKKSKIVAVSTPYGTNNLFYRLYSGAEKGENGWSPMVIPWHMVPGRDEEWKKQTIASIGSEEIFEREFNCSFATQGDSFLDLNLYNKLRNACEEPKYIFDDGAYKIWKDPVPDNLYVAGVDIAEGVGEDASVVQIFDITDLRNIEQVACFASNRISPIHFATKVHEILYHWGTPPAMVERNAVGTVVVDTLASTYNYPYIVSYSAKAGKLDFKKPGIYAHSNTKIQGVTNMRYWLNQLQVVKIRDKTLINELQTFIRYPNGVWSAKIGEVDDKVMSMIWALMVLNKNIYPRYYTVVEYDQNQQPLKLELGDSLSQHFTNIIEGVNVDYEQLWQTPEVNISDGLNSNYRLSEVEQMLQEGWEPLQSIPIIEPEYEQHYTNSILH